MRSVFEPPPLKIGHCSPKDAKIRKDHLETGSFSILNNYAAYSVPWQKWQAFYDKRAVTYVDEMTRNSFAVHYWNHMRIFASNVLRLDPYQPLYKIFKANCPATEKGLLQKMIGRPYSGNCKIIGYVNFYLLSVDMAGFAVNIEVLKIHKPKMPYLAGQEETILLTAHKC